MKMWPLFFILPFIRASWDLFFGFSSSFCFYFSICRAYMRSGPLFGLFLSFSALFSILPCICAFGTSKQAFARQIPSGTTNCFIFGLKFIFAMHLCSPLASGQAVALAAHRASPGHIASLRSAGLIFFFFLSPLGGLGPPRTPSPRRGECLRHILFF